MTKKLILTLVVVLVFGIGTGWLLWGKDTASNQKVSPGVPPGATTQQTNAGSQDSAAADTDGVKSLVSYTLPDGWRDAACNGKSEVVYILPPDETLDCAENPSAPVSISVDPQGITDCNQLDDKQNVTKHVCKSSDINGSRTLQSTTVYRQSAERKAGETLSDYYIDTGKEVVKVEYHYFGESRYQAGFDQLAQSVSLK